MSKRFMIMLLSFVWAPAIFAQSKIELLEPPKAAPPVLPPEDFDPDAKVEEDLQRKREQRRERDKTFETPAPVYSEIRHKKLQKEAINHQDPAFACEIGVLGGPAMVRGNRSDYTSNLTMHFNMFYRYDAKNKRGKTGPWFGFRLAPFSGAGSYKNRGGSYGLTYFGPMIGVGNIGPAADDDQEDGEPSQEEKPKKEPDTSISGWLFSGGIAAVSKVGKTDDEDPDPASDFASKGVAFDSPGVWIEGRYIKIYYGTIGYNIVFGAQTGQEKTFLYTGIGFSGWN